MAYRKSTIADSQEPPWTTRPSRLTAVTASNRAAPPATRTVEKVAGSIVPWPSASRVSTEFPAKAINAAAVHSTVRLSILIETESSLAGLSEPGERRVAILEDLDHETARRQRAKLPRDAECHRPRGDHGDLLLSDRRRVTPHHSDNFLELREGRHVG